MLAAMRFVEAHSALSRRASWCMSQTLVVVLVIVDMRVNGADLLQERRFAAAAAAAVRWPCAGGGSSGGPGLLTVRRAAVLRKMGLHGCTPFAAVLALPILRRGTPFSLWGAVGGVGRGGSGPQVAFVVKLLRPLHQFLQWRRSPFAAGCRQSGVSP